MYIDKENECPTVSCKLTTMNEAPHILFAQLNLNFARYSFIRSILMEPYDWDICVKIYHEKSPFAPSPLVVKRARPQYMIEEYDYNRPALFQAFVVYLSLNSNSDTVYLSPSYRHKNQKGHYPIHAKLDEYL